MSGARVNFRYIRKDITMNTTAIQRRTETAGPTGDLTVQIVARPFFGQP